MKEIFTKYIESILKNEDKISILHKLSDIFAENELYQEQAAYLEKIYHINQDAELYLKIGDIFEQKLNEHEIAHCAYNKYFQLKNPGFYEKYITNLKNFVHENNDFDKSEDKYAEITYLCDNYNCIIHMLIYLHKNKQYQDLLELSGYLDNLKEKIDLYYTNNPQTSKEYIEDIIASNQHIAGLLTKVKNHNDINRLAIKLVPDMQLAYINIAADLIIYNNYSEALVYYNECICSKFKLNTVETISQLCWEISDFYRDVYHFYDSVLFEKIALENDLANIGEKNA